MPGLEVDWGQKVNGVAKALYSKTGDDGVHGVRRESRNSGGSAPRAGLRHEARPAIKACMWLKDEISLGSFQYSRSC